MSPADATRVSIVLDEIGLRRDDTNFIAPGGIHARNFFLLASIRTKGRTKSRPSGRNRLPRRTFGMFVSMRLFVTKRRSISISTPVHYFNTVLARPSRQERDRSQGQFRLSVSRRTLFPSRDWAKISATDASFLTLISRRSTCSWNMALARGVKLP